MRRIRSRAAAQVVGQVGGAVARAVDRLGLLPVGLDEIGESGPVGHLEPERLLEPRPAEVGGHHDHPGTGQGPRGGEVGRDEGLAVTRLGAGDHEDRALLLHEQDPQAGAQVPDRLGQRRLGRLDEGDRDLALLHLGVLGQLAEQRPVDHRLDVGVEPEAVVELLADEGDAAPEQEAREQADGPQLRLGEPGGGARLRRPPGSRRRARRPGASTGTVWSVLYVWVRALICAFRRALAEVALELLAGSS